MRASWKTTAVTTALAAALLSACSGNGGFDEATGAGELNAEGDEVLGQTEQAWTAYYPTCSSASSDPDGDGWGWENYQSCKVSTTSTTTSYTTTSYSCPNPDGTNSVMAALAVATAKELGRWEPLTDFYVSNYELRLTSTGRSRCNDGGICRNTQALLDMQKSVSEGQVKVSPTVTLSASALRSRLVAKFGEQATCEARPDNHNGSDCPAEDHKLRFMYSSKGSCDMDFWFEATKASGGPLQYPAQLKNKLLWVDMHNPYVNFQSSGNMVSIDPTYGLNEDSTASSGSCPTVCTKISSASIIGQCCSCNGVKKFQRSLFNSYIYFCK